MVYIPPRSSTIEMTALPCKDPVSASRKEIFEDRIFFHGATDANQPSTPTRNLRSFKSFQTLSAPAAIRRSHKTVQDKHVGTKLARCPDEQQQSFDSNGNRTQAALSLRRRKTLQDLRSSNNKPGSKESLDRPSPRVLKHKGCSKTPERRPETEPLLSLTNQPQRLPWNASSRDDPKNPLSFGKTPDDNHELLESQFLAAQQSSEGSSSETIFSETELQQFSKSPINDIKMISDIGDLRKMPVDASAGGSKSPSSWNIRNIFDYIGCPEDFSTPITRTDLTPVKDLNPYVKRIDVTTLWKSLSPEVAEELFRVHVIFKDALKSIISEKVRELLSLVRKNFFLKEGNFTYLDGFRVAVSDGWIHVDREQIIERMTVLGYTFFSQMERQPNRSALMQLYLSSTECFLNGEKYQNDSLGFNTGVSIRTFYDQLSTFEVPVARVASFGDYVRFLNLNPTPREDEELLIIPQYNRDGIFVQTPYPEDVKYHMETPVTWLAWNDNIKGFRGRIPTYSAFSDGSDFDRDENEDGCISHTLEIIIGAAFQKSCTTGSAHFERLVRTRLTLYILSKHSSSVEHSVYGIDPCKKKPLFSHSPELFKTRSSAKFSDQKSLPEGSFSVHDDALGEQARGTNSLSKHSHLSFHSQQVTEASKLSHRDSTSTSGPSSRQPFGGCVDGPLNQEKPPTPSKSFSPNDCPPEKWQDPFYLVKASEDDLQVPLIDVGMESECTNQEDLDASKSSLSRKSMMQEAMKMVAEAKSTKHHEKDFSQNTETSGAKSGPSEFAHESRDVSEGPEPFPRTTSRLSSGVHLPRNPSVEWMSPSSSKSAYLSKSYQDGWDPVPDDEWSSSFAPPSVKSESSRSAHESQIEFWRIDSPTDVQSRSSSRVISSRHPSITSSSPANEDHIFGLETLLDAGLSLDRPIDRSEGDILLRTNSRLGASI